VAGATGCDMVGKRALGGAGLGCKSVPAAAADLQYLRMEQQELEHGRPHQPCGGKQPGGGLRSEQPGLLRFREQTSVAERLRGLSVSAPAKRSAVAADQSPDY